MKIEQKIVRRILKWALIIFIVWDFGFSFYQHYHTSIGGDIAQIVIPTSSIGYYDVLKDPFGISVLTGEKSYANPNRFFAHWSASKYLLHVPVILQNFVQPIQSIYLSIALFKTFVQISLIILLTFFATASIKKPSSLEYLIVISLVSALFQTYGYNRIMGIIDNSVIYTFFYALPMIPFFIFLIPVIKWASNLTSYKLRWYWIIIMILLSFPLALGGPLIPGVVLVAAFLVLVWTVLTYFKNPRSVIDFLKIYQTEVIKFGIVIGWLCFLCLYSLFIGSRNTLNDTATISLVERYSNIPTGLWGLLKNKLGLSTLVILIGVNIYLIKRYGRSNNTYILNSFNWLLVFIILYILLLPLGGYRAYRPNIVRYDTMIPVTLALFYIFSQSTVILLRSLKNRQHVFYGLLLTFVIFIYFNADTVKKDAFNSEYNALISITKSEEKVVELDNQYPVLEFRIVHDSLHSKLKSELLTRWNITENNKLFYQKKY